MECGLDSFTLVLVPTVFLLTLDAKQYVLELLARLAHAQAGETEQVMEVSEK